MSVDLRNLLLVLAVVFVLPAAIRPDLEPAPVEAGYGTGDKPEGARAFDAAPIAELDRVRPRFLFIGNSNTYTRIDEAYLEARVGGPVLVQAESNTGGVHWYLQLKNHLLASEARPERVFVFYRTRELGDPYLRAPEQRHAFSRAHEPALAALAEADCTTTGDAFRAGAHRIVQRIWPTVDVRSDDLMNVALAVAPDFLFRGAEPYAFREALNRRFGLGHLRPTVGDDLLAGAALDVDDFERRTRCSTLPALLALARDEDIPLTLVRIQTRTWPHGPEVEAWHQALFASAARHGVEFHDFSGDPEIPRAWYGTADHIAGAHERDWTALFARRVLDD
ncbi:MAG: hypothetical protein AAGC67_17010 [Myxococcota bacterium]